MADYLSSSNFNPEEICPRERIVTIDTVRKSSAGWVKAISELVKFAELAQLNMLACMT